MILEHVWTRLVGDKGRFWELKGVQSGTLYIQVKMAVAKNELIARQRQLIREINKHFDSPWIKKIEINSKKKLIELMLIIMVVLVLGIGIYFIIDKDIFKFNLSSFIS